MKTLPFITSIVLATGALVSVAVAQTSAAVATTPAPTVAMPLTPAPTVAGQASPAPERIIYVPRLPTAAELSNVARAQGVTIDQIDQTSNEVTITYRFADGRTSSVSYQLLPDGGAPQPVAAVAGRTSPTVVYYEPAPRVVYYNRPAVYYDPFYYPWYGPVSLSFGFGYGFHGHGGGHFGGGFRGHGHGRW